MTRTMKIGKTRIADDTAPYIIAEVGHNHQGDLEQCRKLCRAAKAAGANAVKLQKRDNRALFTKDGYDRPYDNPNSFGSTYGAHRDFLEFGLDEYRAMQKECSSLGIDFFATAFDFPSADFLNELDVPAYKIASGDLKTTPLIEYVAKMDKPIILSTGGATQDDVDRAYQAASRHNDQVAILQCTAEYPAKFEDLNLNVIQTFRERYPDAVIGFSGHDNGIAMALASFMLGARIIEKHFTLNRAMKGTDHKFSLEPQGMTKMVRDLTRAKQALGDGVKRAYEDEHVPLVKMGKMLVASRDLPSGHILTAADVAMKSPAEGIPPYRLDEVLGLPLPKGLTEDEPLPLDLVGGSKA